MAITVLARGLLLDVAIGGRDDTIEGRGRLVRAAGATEAGAAFDTPSEVAGLDKVPSVEGRAETEEGRGLGREARVLVGCGLCSSDLVDGTG